MEKFGFTSRNKNMGPKTTVNTVPIKIQCFAKVVTSSKVNTVSPKVR